MGLFDEIRNRKNPIIPEGGTYITADGKEFKAGEHFPTPQSGDVYKIGSYNYEMYPYTAGGELGMKVSLNLQVTDHNKKTYEELLPEINGVKLRSADGLFKDCSKMQKAPSIPHGVSYTETFTGCYGLTQMPKFDRYRDGESFRPVVSDILYPDGAKLPETIKHWDWCNDITRAFGRKQEKETVLPNVRPRVRASITRQQNKAEQKYYTEHPEQINPNNQLYELAKFPILFETFGEKQLGPYRGEPYLSATTGTVIMNAEDKTNSEMKGFDNLDKEDIEEVKGGTVRSERDGHIMKPEIKDTNDIEL